MVDKKWRNMAILRKELRVEKNGGSGAKNLLLGREPKLIS